MSDSPRRTAGTDSHPRSHGATLRRSALGALPLRGPRPLPEPPAFRGDPLTSPRACVNCATPVASSAATPRCWGCGRALCADCYWRHGLLPSVHRCTSCLAAAPTVDPSVSGARATPRRTGFTPVEPPTSSA